MEPKTVTLYAGDSEDPELETLALISQAMIRLAGYPGPHEEENDARTRERIARWFWDRYGRR